MEIRWTFHGYPMISKDIHGFSTVPAVGHPPAQKPIASACTLPGRISGFPDIRISGFQEIRISRHVRVAFFLPSGTVVIVPDFRTFEKSIFGVYEVPGIRFFPDIGTSEKASQKI